MALELRQQLKLSQQLVMTPQLQQAIKLLQLSRLELVNVVQQELVENPVLEESLEEDNGDGASEVDADGPEPLETAESAAAEELAAAEQPDAPEPEVADGEAVDGETVEPTAEDMVGDVDWESYMESRPQTSLAQNDERPSIEDNLTPRESLSDHLLWQLGFADLSDAEKALGLEIIGNLNEDGYLEEDLETLADATGQSAEIAEKVLSRIQAFDPVGVASRSLSECLLVQCCIGHIEDPLVIKIISSHLDLLQRKDYRGIGRIEDATIEEVAVAADVIAHLEPRPGRRFCEDEPVYITPDIFVYKLGDDYHVVLNEDGMPKLRVSSAYRHVLQRNSESSKETREYVRQKLRSAVWLIKSIHQRQRTIVKVVQSLLRFQRDFFDKGTEYLRPLNLRDVADDIGMHESTVSRVTTNKYVQTPHGIFELKYFFNSSIQTSDGSSIASESVKEKIREIIRTEDAHRPLSDQRIAEVLSDSHIKIARRTVTKYRESMRILSSTRRRKIG
jgi:RNA polymerase sigma-54 factor